MADIGFPATTQKRQKHLVRQAPVGCATCANRRPGWFCSLGNAVLADLELATSTISLPAQASLFTQGEETRCLYLICAGYLKLTAGRPQDRQMIVRVAGPGSVLGLYAVLSHGVYEVSAESLTPAQLRPVERERFLAFLRNHKEAQMRAVQCICQEYRFALQDACRISLAETVAGRLGRLLLEVIELRLFLRRGVGSYDLRCGVGDLLADAVGDLHDHVLGFEEGHHLLRLSAMAGLVGVGGNGNGESEDEHEDEAGETNRHNISILLGLEASRGALV